MSVTADTSHEPMGPYRSEEQSPTCERSRQSNMAPESSLLDFGANPAGSVSEHGNGSVSASAIASDTGCSMNGGESVSKGGGVSEGGGGEGEG